MWFIFSNGFFLATLPYRLFVCRILAIVDWRTFTPISANDLCGLKVIIGLSVTSLTTCCDFPYKSLLALMLSFEGWPCLGSAWEVWCSFQSFHTVDPRVFTEISKHLNIIVAFPYPVRVYNFISNFLRTQFGLLFHSFLSDSHLTNGTWIKGVFYLE